ncbi:MAG: anti-sigma factor, partial [Candidatus Limnocylindrales bacterium]
MTRFARIRRRPDHWRSTHERARARAGERLDGPLGLAEAAWLDQHLAECAPCAAVAAAYEADRGALRTLRARPPEPPRDLWARTAAAIERGSSAGRATETVPATRRGSRFPLGAMAGIAVIALVVGVSTLSGGAWRVGSPQQLPVATSGASDVATLASPETDPGAEATPMAVGAGDVTWIDEGPGGSLGYAAVTIDEVCPKQVSGCPMIREGQRKSLGLSRAPRTIFGSPTQSQAVAISDNGDAGDQLVIVHLPSPDETSPPASSPSPSPSPLSPPASDD